MEALEVVEIEEEIRAELKVLEYLPGVVVSSKPDLVVEAASVSLPELATYSKEELSGYVVAVSHKTEGRREDSNIDLHTTSNDTTAQWTVWNELYAKGLKSKPMLGVVMNIVGKQKTPQIYRFFVKANRKLAKEFMMARQLDWWMKARVTPSRSGNCKSRWGMCRFYDLCWDKKFPAAEVTASLDREGVKKRVIELAENYGLVPIPWDERPGTPTAFGMSRFNVINNCGMEHWLGYEACLTTPFTDKNLEIGTAFHCLAAAHYRGHATEHEKDTFRGLRLENVKEARRIYSAYVEKYGGTEQIVVPDSELSPTGYIIQGGE